MKPFFVLIHLFFLTLLSFLAVQMFYDGCIPARPVDSRTTIMPDAAPSRKPPQFPLPGLLLHKRFSKVTQRNLFQVTLAPPSGSEAENQAPLAVDSLEETRLDLKLAGTIVFDSGREAFAIIQEGKKKEQKRYRKGDSIQGAEITAVLREKVVLRYKGRDEVLHMEAAKGGKKPMVEASPLVSGLTPLLEKNILDRSQIDKALGSINKLMGQVRIRPHFSGGKADGLLMYGIKKDSLFQNMGLKNGDIIMGVDGREIQSVDDALTFYEQLKDGTDINLQIKRRGQIKEIQYHVE